MALKKVIVSFIFVPIIFSLVACGAGLSATTAPTPTIVWQEGMPREGQPAFPKLGQYWVIDDGCGFDPKTTDSGGIDMRSMRERVIQIGAKLKISSSLGLGTKIVVTLKNSGHSGEK